MAQKQPITQRSTKTDLFNAYQEMKEKVEMSQKNQLPLPQQAEIKKEEEKILQKTENLLPQNLEDDISSLHKKIQETFNGLKDNLVQESGKLKELRSAIEIETKRLEETHNIKLANDTLQTLIADYETKQKELEKRKIQEETSITDEMEQQKKAWEREKEEYKYNLKIERQKEEDAYNIEQNRKKSEWQDAMNKKESELNEREEEGLNSRTEQIENMKAQIDEFPKKIETAIENAKKEKEMSLQKDFDVQKQIAESRWNSEKNMFEVRINNSQEIIKNQNAEIMSLKKSLYEANQRAQSLATTIVENASGGKVKQGGSEEERKAEQM
ncbi:MAG: hypothetical protein ABIC82_02940 [bacterium]